jgi:hypothetical protein
MNNNFTPLQPLNTAVLFLVFNRLDTTKRVFAEIKKAKPPRLYIAADGQRESVEGEAKKIKEICDYIMVGIDWDCDVKTLFREKNLGCKYAVSSAITWFFENEERGIILEDDCLPSQSFFWFCEELLEKYKKDETVYMVSGDARTADNVNMLGDYGFCKYANIWGWASWARVWKNYDAEMLDWNSLASTLPQQISNYRRTNRFWKITFEETYNGKIDTWDYQLFFLLFKNKANSIIPRVNLITNIGFGDDATHTSNANSALANRKRYEIITPMKHHPSELTAKKINKFYDKNFYRQETNFVRLVNKLARIFINRNVL